MKNIRERDKKLILLLLIVAIVGLPYFLFVQPAMEKNTALEEEIAQLEQTKATLEGHLAKVPQYQADMEAIGAAAQVIFERFPESLSQEAAILFVDRTEKGIPLRLHQVSLSDTLSVPFGSSDEAVPAPTTEAETAATGTDATATEESAAEDSAGESVIAPDLIGLSTTLQFTYSAGYEEFKEFLTYIMSRKDRMVITELTAGFALDTVDGSFKLMQYGIAGTGREPEEVVKPVIPQGTTNIFLDAAGNFAGGVAQPTQSDCFIMLNRPGAAMDAKIVGMAGDAAGATYLTDDSNSLQEITVTFEGEGGNYTVNYSIGEETFTDEPTAFTKDGAIYLEIISSPRAEEDDEVAAAIGIINRTDQAVYVTVLEDDEVNPRITNLEQTGTVIIN